MKFIKKILFMCFFILLFTGCKESKMDVLKDLSRKIDGLNSYHLTGVLDINNDENTYSYDVDVSFLKENFFRVLLKNKTNNHEQVILRNGDGVFVVTPSLNKSFKFQSEWPYNNSQCYLLHNLISDIKNDSDKVFEVVDDGYIVSVVSNYSNNKDLVKEKIYIDKDKNINKVEVLDSDDVVKMKMVFDNIDYNYSYNSEDFNLDNNMSVFSEIEVKKVIDNVLYPMYIPQNTFLSSQDKVSINGGERVIMTFSGDYPFMVIEETASNSNSLVSVFGAPFQLSDTVGIIDDTSVTWVSDGIEYYLVSNSLDKGQLVDIANSMTTSAIIK
jgi:outer membrane lipoprotein-sorting protein